ncbi:MAG TPA: acyl carrier protein [Thermoanaerobaculia bacterium]|nr:acyl carrier protein [Thermoanaerobaculia bacterium]
MPDVPDEVVADVYTILDARNPSVELRADTPLGSGGLGLDSIALVELLLECEDRFGVEIATEALTASPLTVGALVERIRTQS